ncbi:MAG: cupin domain-containing protein [Candidatus Contendobacter sp.]|nr:cupin domain-containing protein [Candidatus Contendobacter sp.]
MSIDLRQRIGALGQNAAFAAHLAVLWLVSIPGLALAAAPAPAPILPERLTWVSPPTLPALRSAWLVGSESQTGLYLLRVKLAPGGRIPPHIHPDERITTVLSGTLHVGFGTAFAETGAVAIPAGAAYIAPARTPHFVWAQAGDVEYQEMGQGPTGTVFLPAESTR